MKMFRAGAGCALTLLAVCNAWGDAPPRASVEPAPTAAALHKRADADFQRQVEIGRLHLRLEQELELTQRLRSMLDILKQLEPHAEAIKTLFADTPGTRVLLDALENLNANPSSTRPQLVFAETKQGRAILRVGGRYRTLRRGQSLTLNGEDYRLEAIGVEGAALRSLGDGHRINVPWSAGR